MKTAKTNLRLISRPPRIRTLFWIGFVATLVLVSAVIISQRTFNFEIFRYGTMDAWLGNNPYTHWDHVSISGRILDRFQYAPLFSVLFLPFALPPVWIGGLLWVLFSYAVTFWAMYLTKGYRSSADEFRDPGLTFVFFYTIIVLISSLQAFQYNALNAALCLLVLFFLEKKQYIPAMLMVVIGGLTKVYPGFAALLFCFYPDFWKRPIRVVWGFGILAVGLLLPALFTGLEGLVPYTMDWVRWMEAKDLTRVHGLSSLIDQLGYHGIIKYSSVVLLSGIFLPFAKAWILLLKGRVKNDYRLRATLLGTMMVGLLVWGNSAEENTWIIGMLGWLLFYFTKEKKTWIDHACTILLYVVFGIIPMDFLFPVSASKYLLFGLRLGSITGTLIWLRMFLYTPSSDPLKGAS